MVMGEGGGGGGGGCKDSGFTGKRSPIKEWRNHFNARVIVQQYLWTIVLLAALQIPHSEQNC